MLTAHDLVLCSGTLPRRATFAERVAAASAAGFRGISLWGRDYQAARDAGLSDADMRAMLDDHGLEVAELDPAWWWLPGAADIHIPPEVDSLDVFRFGEAELFAVADALDARSVNAVDVFGGEWTLEQAAEAFADLCARADDHGLLVHLEWLAWSRLPDLTSVLAVVEMADAANGGLNVDAWHFTRAATDIEDLRRVPGHRVLAVQLDDGPAEPEPDLMHATLHDRLLPGEGEFALDEIVATLAQIGSTAPIGVEVFSDSLHASGPDDAARRAAETTRSVLERVPTTHKGEQ